ncbi:MAG: transcription antitermination factor NusB [Elusimicrobiota bacterium]|nr:transcription antitermination factor NusB [Elusimicrobiota bacterium]
MGQRRDSRKLAVRVLYIMDNLGIDIHKAWEVVRSSSVPGAVEDFARKLVKGTAEHMEYINGIIAKLAKNWDMDRIARVDIAVIRLGLYEIFFEEDIPRKVSINEAVELAKYFSTEKSHKFVNGILDAAKKEVDED